MFYSFLFTVDLICFLVYLIIGFLFILYSFTLICAFFQFGFFLVHQHKIDGLIYTTFSWHFQHQKKWFFFFLSEGASSRRTKFYTSPPSCKMFHERELNSFKPHDQFGKTLAYTKAPACPDILGVSYLPSFLYFTFQINQLGID